MFWVRQLLLLEIIFPDELNNLSEGTLVATKAMNSFNQLAKQWIQ